MKWLKALFISILLLPAACAAESNSSKKSGKMISTIYYKPVINAEDSGRCQKNEAIQDIRTPEGYLLLTMCESERKRCLMQGTCLVKLGGDEIIINYTKKVRNEYRFRLVNLEECPFGFGVRGSCLDPFYSIAADLRYFRLGDVIHVPTLVGVELPDGSRHTGYLIVRDAGGMIKGPHRFDLFTGYLDHLDSENPFKKLGLGDPDNRFQYRRVSGAEAESVRQARNFPKFPKN